MMGTGWESFSDLSAELDRLVTAEFDLSGCRAEIVRVVQEGNRHDRLAGLDREGYPLAPLAQSTLATRDGDGPPLAPHGVNSRVIANLIVDCIATPGTLSVVMSWPGCPWLRFHSEGTGRLPKRDIQGLPRVDEPIVLEIILKEANRLLAESIRTGR